METTSLIEKYIQVRHELHKFPELSLKEFNTKLKLLEILKSLPAYPFFRLTEAGETGFYIDISGTGPALPYPITIALRTDMDGLPVKEKTGLSYSSQNEGVMHACGHDGHMSILLCTVDYIASRLELLPSNYTLRCLFQPAEETLQGAPLLIKAGCLEGVDQVFGLHNVQMWETGTIAVKSGPIMANDIKFKIRLIGQGGHGSLPHKAKSPILGLSKLVTEINQIVSDEVDAKEMAVLSFGRLSSGLKSNVIPNDGELEGTIRIFNEELGDFMVKRLNEITKGLCSSFGLDYELDTQKGKVLINGEKSAALLKKVGEQVGKVTEEQLPIMASEDFSYYTALVEGAFFMLGGMDETHKNNIHTDMYNFNDDSLEYGVKMYLKIVEETSGADLEINSLY